jgi:DNA-binding MarR family transcriptional regulator
MLPTLGRVSNSNERLANLLGAASVGVADSVQESMVAAGGLDLAGSSALVAMLDFTPAGTVQALSQVMGLTHSGAVRLVDRLAEAGHVERTAGDDARSRRVRLTRRGSTVARRVRAARETALADVVDGLTAAERAALTKLSARIVARLTDQRLAARAAGSTPAGGALCRVCDFAACGRPEGLCPAANTAAATAIPGLA